ncbi:MAG: hypothetical protein AB7G75_03005 [Candidatus Binatia bacterium]
MKHSQLLLLVLLFLCLFAGPPSSFSASAQERTTPTADTSPVVSDTQTIDLRASEYHDEAHPHRSPLLSPEEDRAYSELNHHIAGIFVCLVGGLALLARQRPTQFAWAQSGWPIVFILLAVFLFVRHDPESWPFGPLSLQESLTDVQVVQHFIFTSIVLSIGVVEWLRSQGKLTHPLWSLTFPALAVSAALMLFTHPHGEGPSAEKVYRHHATMAVAGIAAMIAKVLEDTQVFANKVSSYAWSGLIVFIGVMLLLYSE